MAATRVTSELHATELEAMPGYYEYAGGDAATWHVNFADPFLFVAYGSRLLAQDELQCVEHPALGSIREALGEHALTEQDNMATPVLIAGVERRCVLATAPNRGRRSAVRALRESLRRRSPRRFERR